MGKKEKIFKFDMNRRKLQDFAMELHGAVFDPLEDYIPLEKLDALFLETYENIERVFQEYAGCGDALCSDDED